MALRMVGWRILVKPKPSKHTSSGGIVLVDETQEAEEHLKYIGQVVDIGEAAMQTKTTGGIDMGQFQVRPKVGDWILFSPYSGFRIHYRSDDEDDKGILLVIKDTDVHGVFDSFEDTEAYYSWVAA